MREETMQEYVELGGLIWGNNIVASGGVTWPMATLRASAERMEIKVKWFWLKAESFEFSRQEILSLEKYKVLFTTRILIKHNKKNYPPFILYAPGDFDVCKAGLGLVNYQIIEPTKSPTT